MNRQQANCVILDCFAHWFALPLTALKYHPFSISLIIDYISKSTVEFFLDENCLLLFPLDQRKKKQ